MHTCKIGRNVGELEGIEKQKTLITRLAEMGHNILIKSNNSTSYWGISAKKLLNINKLSICGPKNGKIRNIKIRWV